MKLKQNLSVMLLFKANRFIGNLLNELRKKGKMLFLICIQNLISNPTVREPEKSEIERRFMLLFQIVQ